MRTANDAEIIEAALEEFKKTVYVEIAMGEAVQKVDDLEKSHKKPLRLPRLLKQPLD